MLNQKLVHLDLKGSPPKIDYLIKLLPIFKSLGATGLLIEYEDVFPYDNHLKVIKNNYFYYKETELQCLFEACIKNKLIIIPLIQTLGHVEFILKHVCFGNLREVPSYPNMVCPTNEKSLQLICSIIEQIVSLHSKYIDLKYIHLGLDEVYFLANCSQCSCKCNENQWPKDILFLEYVSKLADIIHNDYNLIPIMWDDMLRNTSEDSIEKFNLNKKIQLMVWHYTTIDNFQLADQQLWNKYLKLFDQIWVASAFKGAYAVDQCMPPIEFHLQNQLAWLQIIKKFILNNSNYRQNLVGIALTGWSKFDHFMTCCEILPLAIPSLAICLQTIVKSNFNEEAHKQASEKLKFSTLIPLNLISNSDEIYADFPGNQLFILSIKLMECKNDYKLLFKHPSLKGGFTDYQIKQLRTNPLHIHSFISNAKFLLSKFQYLNLSFENELKQIFHESIVKEFLECNMKKNLDKLNRLVTDCNQQLLLNGFYQSN